MSLHMCPVLSHRTPTSVHIRLPVNGGWARLASLRAGRSLDVKPDQRHSYRLRRVLLIELSFSSPEAFPLQVISFGRTFLNGTIDLSWPSLLVLMLSVIRSACWTATASHRSGHLGQEEIKAPLFRLQEMCIGRVRTRSQKTS
jgi:hypothetical protein